MGVSQTEANPVRLSIADDFGSRRLAPFAMSFSKDERQNKQGLKQLTVGQEIKIRTCSVAELLHSDDLFT